MPDLELNPEEQVLLEAQCLSKPGVLAYSGTVTLTDRRLHFEPRKLDRLAGACGVIVASEVLYREEHYGDIAAILAFALAPGGVAVIGTKRVYFGAALGGGSASFVASVAAAGCGLAARVDGSVEDGRSMTRDIVVLEFEKRESPATGDS
jgi:hypothetical protein